MKSPSLFGRLIVKGIVLGMVREARLDGKIVVRLEELAPLLLY